MKITKTSLFKRQIALTEIGKIGQIKLQNASVLVVGCGGLGSPIAVGLAASGVGKIYLVDFDTVAISNLHRQLFYSLEDVGKPKSMVLATYIEKRAPFTEVLFSKEFITKKNVFDFISKGDIIVDGTDSLPTKYLLNDACVLKKKPLVYGSLYKFDGYVSTFNHQQNEEKQTANLRDAFPEMTTEVPNCEEAGTLNSIVGIIANLQINEVLKLVTGIGKPLTNELLIYNSLENSQLKIKLKATFPEERINHVFEKETYFDPKCTPQNNALLISANSLKEQLQEFEIISVIENTSVIYPFKIAQKIPLNSIENTNFRPKKNTRYVLVCMKGNTSYLATKKLKEKHPKTTFLSLVGGIINYK